MMEKKILCASHHTRGARAAESLALTLCHELDARMYHLEVIPSLWDGVMGDDWLNNAVVRSRFGDYMEAQLLREASEHRREFFDQASRMRIGYVNRVVYGEPTAVLLREARSWQAFDFVVIGSPRPVKEGGLCSELSLHTLMARIDIPLIAAPYPSP